ncbi:SMI1/KNR4 family protein [Streptomyces sp. NPDC059909]|uniref:SMI1/KNR4 family protein n=1 Tax=Streptomyces sp. NPDC059909 TaxID=3346998 RepID=UPI003651714C
MGEGTQHIWAGARERVTALREHGGAREVFGARGHGFELQPPMSEQDVRALETELGTELPAEYRSFLLTVGAGGAGPDYGLTTPLCEDGRWAWRGVGLAYEGMSTAVSDAGMPFAPDEVQRLLDAYDDEEPEPDDYPDQEEFRRAHRAWDDRYEELYDAQTAGSVFIGEQGCGYYSLLVITGEHRGTVWDDVRACDGGIVPKGGSFAAWYLTWLARAEAVAYEA